MFLLFLLNEHTAFTDYIVVCIKSPKRTMFEVIKQINMSILHMSAVIYLCMYIYLSMKLVLKV